MGGKPTCMVSHAWLYKMKHLYNIILDDDNQADRNETQFYFLDILSMNQHDLSEVVSGRSRAQGVPENNDIHKVLLENLTKAIVNPGRMLLALDPWDHPAPLERCWC